MEFKHIRVINEGTVFCKDRAGCRECPTSCQSACKTSCTVGSQICRQEELNR